jgi:hypothetical protein
LQHSLHFCFLAFTSVEVLLEAVSYSTSTLIQGVNLFLKFRGGVSLLHLHVAERAVAILVTAFIVIFVFVVFLFALAFFVRLLILEVGLV